MALLYKPWIFAGVNCISQGKATFPSHMLKEKLPRYIMALLYVVAGSLHFLRSAMYIGIMPSYLPYPLTLVYISGLAEIIFGLLLLNRKTKKIAAWGIMVLLVAVFPANIQMLLNYSRDQHQLLWIAVLRLPLQVILIWWAWHYAKK